MPRSRRPVAVSVWAILVAMSTGACTTPETSRTTATGDHDGLIVEMSLHPTSDSLVVDTTVRNARGTAVHLDASQCGRVTEVILARTFFQPEGATYSGSIDALKR